MEKLRRSWGTDGSLREPSFLAVARKWIKVLLPLSLGILLILGGEIRERRDRRTGFDGVETYNRAFMLLERGEVETACALFDEAAFYARSPELRAVALHNAATCLWLSGLGEYDGLVARYIETLRTAYQPSEINQKASFNLELLYFLKTMSAPAVEPGVEGEGKGGPLGPI